MTINHTTGDGKISVDFCDLCNESVPHTDIESGLATQIKGRVVCATCNKAMSVARDAAQSASGFPPSSGVAQASTHPATHPVHVHRATSSSSGAWVGVLALLGAAGLGWWTFGELKRRDAEQTGWRARIEADRADERSRMDDVLERRKEDVDALTVLAERESERVAIELGARLREIEAKDAALEAKLAALTTRAETADETLERFARHDQELVTLQERYASLDAELDRIVDQFDAALREMRESADAAATPAAAAEQKPAWFALTTQLSSESANERWKAVVALGETKDPATAPYLVPVLRDIDQFLRYYAARTLGELGNVVAVGALIDALSDAEDVVREEAYQSLKLLTKRDFPFDPRSIDVSEREKRIKAWRDWWEKERPKGSS